MFDFSFFDEIHDRTKSSAIKYTNLPEAEKTPVIPMWIADMNFATVPTVVEAIQISDTVELWQMFAHELPAYMGEIAVSLLPIVVFFGLFQIVSLKLEKKQLDAARKIAALGLSVRQAELLCKNMDKPAQPKPEVTLAVDYIAECEKSLSRHLGRGVKIINGKRKGKFELEFYGQEDLQTLLDALMKLQK